MSEPRVYTLGIDVQTRCARTLRGRLRRLKSTSAVEDGGAYTQDPAWSQVHLDTTMDLEALDDWLWKYSRAEYSGTYERTAK